jgi:putative membrane protein
MSGHFVWPILLFVVLGVLLWGVLGPRRGGSPAADKSDSLEILKTRLAKGEITIEEYKNLKSML